MNEPKNDLGAIETAKLQDKKKGSTTSALKLGAAWMRGQIIPLSEASIPVNDWGLVRSDITYDVVPVINGGFFRLSNYIDRFVASMKGLKLEPQLSKNDIENALLEMVGASGLRNSYVTMVCSRGIPTIPGSRDPRECENYFYAWCVPYIHVIKPEVIARGASALISVSVKRIDESSFDPTIKNYHWGDFTRGLYEAKEQNYDTALLVDHKDCLTEGPGFNIFVVKDGKLMTPIKGVLQGITRQTVLEIAESLQISTEVREITKPEVLDADEIFLSTSAGGVMPLVRVNSTIYSNGKPGNISEKIRKKYWDWTELPCYRTLIDYSD